MKLLVITLTCFAILLARVNSQSSSSDSSSASASSASASSASASSASASSASAGASSSASGSSTAAASSSAGGGGGGASSSGSVAASGTSAAASAGSSATAGGGATSSAAAAASSAGTNTATSTAASSSSTAAATMTCLYCNSSTNCASATQTVTCPGQCWGLRYKNSSDSYYFLGCLADVQTFSWFPTTAPACASTNGDTSFEITSGGDVCAYVPHCCTASGSCNTHGSLTVTPSCSAGSSMLVASIAAMLISLLPALWIHS